MRTVCPGCQPSLTFSVFQPCSGVTFPPWRQSSSRRSQVPSVLSPPVRKISIGPRKEHWAMNAWMRTAVALSLIVVLPCCAMAQPPDKNDEPLLKLPPAPPATLVAATVNGQEILELDVYRGLLREDPKIWADARKEVVNYLIDNCVVDQYLTQLKIEVNAKDIDERFAQIQDEAKKSNQDFAEILKKLHITEPQLRKELQAALRWDKFVLQQGTEKV